MRGKLESTSTGASIVLEAIRELQHKQDLGPHGVSQGGAWTAGDSSKLRLEGGRKKYELSPSDFKSLSRDAPRFFLESGIEESAAVSRGAGPLSRLNQKANTSASEAARERQKRLIGFIAPDHPALVTPVRETVRPYIAPLPDDDRGLRVGKVRGTGTPSWANKPRRSVVSERYEAGKVGLSKERWAEDAYEAALLKRDTERLRLEGRAAHQQGDPTAYKSEEGWPHDSFEERLRKARDSGSADRYSTVLTNAHTRYSASPEGPKSVDTGFMADETRVDMGKDRLSASPDAFSNVNVGFVADDTLAVISPYEDGRRLSPLQDLYTRDRSSSQTPPLTDQEGKAELVGWRHCILTERSAGSVRSGYSCAEDKHRDTEHKSVNAERRYPLGSAPRALQQHDESSEHHWKIYSSFPASQQQARSVTPEPQATELSFPASIWMKAVQQAHAQMAQTPPRVSFAAAHSDAHVQDTAQDHVTSTRHPISRRTAFESPREASTQQAHGTPSENANKSRARDMPATSAPHPTSPHHPPARMFSPAAATGRSFESAYRGGGMHLGLEAMGNLALSARVHLHMGLTMPKSLAAVIIQSVWRSYAVRRTALVLIAHAQRVCQIVDKHRRATSNAEDESASGRPLKHRRHDGKSRAGALWAFHCQDKLKQRVAHSWSSRRVTYPLPNPLRATCPYSSSGLESCLCICFVSNLVAFYLESRSKEEGSEASQVAVSRLQAIVEAQQREMLLKAQAHIRGWLTRRRALSVLMPPAPWSLERLFLAQNWRRAGRIVQRRIRQYVCVTKWRIHGPVIRQLHIMAQAEQAFLRELDVAISCYVSPLRRAAGSLASLDDEELDDAWCMIKGAITPKDAARICGAMSPLREKCWDLLEALRSCLGNLPNLKLDNVLNKYTQLFPALCQHICNFPSCATMLSKYRRCSPLAEWIESVEETASASLAASLLAPVERLDDVLSALSALRDSASPLQSYHADLQACLRSSLETVGQQRYRKRDCHEMMRLLRISEQFVGDIGLDIVRPHRRLVRSSKLMTLKATDYYIDIRGMRTASADETHAGDEQVVIGGANLLFFLFNDCLVGASVSTCVHDDGTVTPEKRRGPNTPFLSPPHSASPARRAAALSTSGKSASKTAKAKLEASLARHELLYRMEAVVPLLRAHVTDEQDVPDKGIQHAIRIDDMTGQVMVLRAQSDKDKQEWLQDLRSMAAALEETLATPYAPTI